MDTTEIKRRVGYEAVDRAVRSGMKLGLGTGSTAIHAVRRVGELLATGTLTDIMAVTTSFGTRIECQRLGIPLYELNDPAIDGRLDLSIDGSDEVDPKRRLTKGGGGALLIEKLVEYLSDRLIIIVDESKIVSRLGERYPIPLEVIPIARVPVERAVVAYGARPVLRMAEKKSGPVYTDQGNVILDLFFDSEFDPVELERELNTIPGAVENGIFTKVSPEVIIGHPDGSISELAS
jgi:ribose 5-phosphate isomerase A